MKMWWTFIFSPKIRLIQALRRAERETVQEALQLLRWHGWLVDGSLRGVFLAGADLHGYDLRGICLAGADLRGVNFWDSDLRGANLAGAALGGADLEVANLQDADLREARLGGANLYGATMPDGKKWHSKVNLPYFTDPRSLYYGEAPYACAVNIVRQFRQR